jgi:hypothetical protein
MLKNVGFETLLASPPEYNGLVAEIYYDGKFVALVSEERGPGLFEVETPGSGLVESRIRRRVDLPGFITALEAACHRLSQKLV